VSDHPINRRRFEQGVLVFDYGATHMRCGGTADKPWFVAKDVCDVLGIIWRNDVLADLDDDQRGYASVVTPGGKQKMAVVYESGLYELVIKSRKPEAKVFRKWITSEVLPSIRKTGAYRLKQRQRYQQVGLSPEWIEKREQGVAVRKGFTATLQEHGLSEGWEYGRATDAIYYSTLGGPASTVRQRLGLPKGANLRDNLPLLEIFVVGLAEHLAQDKIEKDNRQGCEAVVRACAIAANNIANAVKQTQSGRMLPPS
jgi:prophage antirepressor-like protein